MSERYPGGIISKTAPTPTGPYENGTAPGIWTLEQQLQYQQQGVWPTAGLTPSYIEDVFSTYVYTGTGNTNTIINGINLSSNGGLVWTKSRSNAYNNWLFDTARGAEKVIISNTTAAQGATSGALEQFNSNGYRLGYSGGGYAELNQSAVTYVSWTFREQAKFFDIVTFTSASSGNTTFSHNLGSTPGCVFIKNTQTSDPWIVYHTSVGNNAYLQLNSAAVQDPLTGAFSATSTTFTISSSLMYTSQSYVAYIFANNAGGFGPTGTENVITCGSYVGTGNTSGATINLGYEPQWILTKSTSGTGFNWGIIDNMRGIPLSGNTQYLWPNDSSQETAWQANGVQLNSTGFQIVSPYGGINEAGSTFIYIAIRRGPMKIPTDALTVFDVGTRSGSGSIAKTNSDILTDLTVIKRYTSASEYWAWTPRLVGNLTLQSNSTDGELSGAMATNTWDTMTGAFCAASNGATNTSTLVDYSFRRAPGFFDVVCYTGNYAGNPEVYHNLGVAPEMILAKNRGGTVTQWYIHHTGMGASEEIYFNTNQKSAGDLWTRTSTYWKNSSAQYPTGEAHVAYLFATLAGISKVGSYTGTGALQTIDCGFTTSARFILIKRTNATGDWYLYDSANGITSGNDPYLLTNTTGAQVTGTNYVEDTSVGFKVNAAGSTTINVSGGTYIFLAIA